MLAIYIVTLLVLTGSGILPTKVHAGPGSRDSDEKYCSQALPRQQAIDKKIKDLTARKQPLPACACGPLGTVSKIDIFSNGKTTTLVTCASCKGIQVPITSSAECANVPDCFCPDLDTLCKIVQSRCKNYTVYRCGSPAAVSTTTARTTSVIATTTSTKAPTTTVATTTTSTKAPTTTVATTTTSTKAPTTTVATTTTSTKAPTTTVATTTTSTKAPTTTVAMTTTSTIPSATPAPSASPVPTTVTLPPPTTVTANSTRPVTPFLNDDNYPPYYTVPLYTDNA